MNTGTSYWSQSWGIWNHPLCISYSSGGQPDFWFLLLVVILKCINPYPLCISLFKWRSTCLLALPCDYETGCNPGLPDTLLSVFLAALLEEEQLANSAVGQLKCTLYGLTMAHGGYHEFASCLQSIFVTTNSCLIISVHLTAKMARSWLVKNEGGMTLLHYNINFNETIQVSKSVFLGKISLHSL